MDRVTQLRVENAKLKEKVDNLEQRILSIVGLIKIFPSGVETKKEELNNRIQELLSTPSSNVRIVTPKIGPFYLDLITKIAQKGIPVLLIINDRRNIPTEYQQYYDQLKNKTNISIVNNPNVKYLLVMNDSEVIYSGGSLVQKELSGSILVGTQVKEKNKITKIQKIFNNMLPSFMR